MPTLAEIRAVPKVLLHDHLDGGLRPQTVLELARETGYHDLPGDNTEELTQRLTEGAHRGHLEIYLDAFRHTVAVMQTADALRRVAAECAEDLAADGVVYAEVRFAPELHTERGLSLDEVVEAVLDGFARGRANQARAGRGITVYALLTAMRTAARSLEIAELAVRYRDRGVVGFDIAGAEAGWPPSRHLDAFQFIKRENFHITIHAGEAFGLPSIWEAVQWCGTERLGHGVRIVDDIQISSEGNVRLGRLAAYIRDRRIPLEMCPTSNVQTGAAPSIALHPIRLLRQLSFRVTVNTDNRLMSQVTLSSEFHRLASRIRLWLVRHRMADGKRDEKRVRGFRRTAAPHQHGHQAGVRHRPGDERCGGPGQHFRCPRPGIKPIIIPNGIGFSSSTPVTIRAKALHIGGMIRHDRSWPLF